MHMKDSGADKSVEEQVQLRRVFRMLAFDIPLQRLEHKLEKLEEKAPEVRSPERISARRRNVQPEHEAKRERYIKERDRYLSTLQEEVNYGRELVGSKFRIDGKALLAIYERLGYPVTGHTKIHTEDLVWQLNDNLDGAICFEEFANSYVRARSDRTGLEPSEMFFLTCFLMFDKECCGKISLDDAMSILYLKYSDAMEKEMETHFGKLLDEGAHFVTFTEYRDATVKRLGELIDQQAYFVKPNKFCKRV